MKFLLLFIGLAMVNTSFAQEEEPVIFYASQLEREFEKIENLLKQSKHWTDTAAGDMAGNLTDTAELSLSRAKLQHGKAFTSSNSVVALDAMPVHLASFKAVFNRGEKKEELKKRYDDALENYTLLQRRIDTMAREITKKSGGELLTIIEQIQALLKDPNLPEDQRKTLEAILEKLDAAATSGNKTAVKNALDDAKEDMEKIGIKTSASSSASAPSISLSGNASTGDISKAASDIYSYLRSDASAKDKLAFLDGLLNDSNTPEALKAQLRSWRQQVADGASLTKVDLTQIAGKMSGGSMQTPSTPELDAAAIQAQLKKDPSIRVIGPDGSDVTNFINNMAGKNGVEAKYSGTPGTFLTGETVIEVAGLIRDANNPKSYVADFRTLSVFAYNFSIQVDPNSISEEADSYTATYLLENQSTQSGDYSVSEWEINGPSGEVIFSEGNSATIKFSESGRYLLKAKGTTALDSAFEITSEAEVDL